MREFHRLGLRPILNHRNLPGKPDMVFPSKKFAVFVHGCFFHGCPLHYRLPKTNRKFWARKFTDNRRRDRRVRRELNSLGWRVAVVWECDLKTLPTLAVNRLISRWRRIPRKR